MINTQKQSCQFIVTQKKNNVIYGRFCHNLCINGDICNVHQGKNNQKFDVMTDNTCQHIITQKSRNLDRKGMICGQFTFDSKNHKYCKHHASRHNDLEDFCLRSFKVRFHPSKDQISKLMKYFGTSRYTYNQCLQNKENESFVKLREKYVTNTTKDFVKETPKEIRAFSVKEYVTNKKNMCDSYSDALKKESWKRENYQNYKHKTIKKYEMQFQKKKEEQSITINKDCVKIKNKQIQIYPTMFGKSPLVLIKRSQKDKRLNSILNGILQHDIKIIKTETNKYYICFTDDVKKEEKQNNNDDACTIDPGVRTLWTTYNEKQIEEIGTNMNEVLGQKIKEKEQKHKKYKKAIINIKKESTTETKTKLIKAKIKYKLINEKLKNMVDDLHYKAITKLMKYPTIYIPKLNTKRMLEENQLNGSVKRLLQMESHGKLIRRLQEKGEEKGVKIEIVTEIMTTKMCSVCFTKNDPKASKTYECSECKIKLDRDQNASKNIYMQVISNLLSKLI